MYRQAWQSEILRLIVVVGLLTALGWSFQYPLYGLLAGLIAIVGINYYYSRQLFLWANNRREQAPLTAAFVGASADIFVRRERKLRSIISKQSRRLKELNQGIESLNDGIVVLDQSDQIVNMNGSARLLLNLRKGDRGQHISNLVRAPEFNEYLQRAKFNKPLMLDIAATSLMIHITEFGEDQRVVLIRDVTERHRVEKMRQNFIADVSHELRTPLTVISGYLEMLVEQEHTAGMQKALANMFNQSQRMNVLVNDLIELSKLESVNRSRRGETFSLGALCERTADQLASYREGCRVDVNVMYDAKILGFESELASVLTNLTSNAIKYGDGTTVKIIVANHSAGIKISVIDRGTGIAPEHIDHLTERFYRADSSRESEIGGSGLGLAIVKHALENHDATLSIESEIGEGSIFSFIIPEARVVE